jgi:3-hydroxybutyryl-CoA dehydrogenase
MSNNEKFVEKGDNTQMDIRTVGVIGAGVMGCGVAQDLAQTGHRVVLLDLSQAILDRAQNEIKRNVRLHSLLTQGEATRDPDEVLEWITFATDYEAVSNVDFVIENVPEKWTVKKAVYAQLDATCPERCCFASNTSAIPITRIASVTGRPTQVLGMHFMNPVPLKQVVEVIRGFHTGEETIRTARHLLTQMGKDCIIVNDSPGFVSNRVLMLTINEAIYLVQEQVAQVEDVDAIFKTCFGHKMGPLETADLIGLDTILYSLEVLCENLSDTKYKPCPLLMKMVDAGLLGRKSGRGFYTHQVV